MFLLLIGDPNLSGSRQPFGPIVFESQKTFEVQKAGFDRLGDIEVLIR